MTIALNELSIHGSIVLRGPCSALEASDFAVRPARRLVNPHPIRSQTREAVWRLAVQCKPSPAEVAVLYGAILYGLPLVVTCAL